MIQRLALLVLCGLLFAGCPAKQPAPAGGDAPAQSASSEEEAAIAAATAHYRALEANDRSAFEDTCSPSILRTSVPMYWTTGRRYVEKYGVRWEYDHVQSVRADRYKVFFRRIQSDGSQRGSPVPCTVDLEGARWVVTTSTQ